MPVCLSSGLGAVLGAIARRGPMDDEDRKRRGREAEVPMDRGLYGCAIVIVRRRD